MFEDPLLSPGENTRGFVLKPALWFTRRRLVPGIESDNLRKDFDALRSQGLTFAEAEPEDYPFGIRATALDPDGNAVCLRQRNGKQELDSIFRRKL